MRACVRRIAVKDALLAFEELNPDAVRDGDGLRPYGAVPVRHGLEPGFFLAARQVGSRRKCLWGGHGLKSLMQRPASTQMRRQLGTRPSTRSPTNCGTFSCTPAEPAAEGRECRMSHSNAQWQGPDHPCFPLRRYSTITVRQLEPVDGDAPPKTMPFEDNRQAACQFISASRHPGTLVKLEPAPVT